MIVVVGGAGYIGSTMVETLLAEDREVLVVDDLSLGHRWAVPEHVELVETDMADVQVIEEIAREYDVEAVMHFSALAKVGESMEQPRRYWRENFQKSKRMIDAWFEQGIENFIFSSSAATYGEPDEIPITEEEVAEPINPYGRTKRAVEWYLEDLHERFGVRSVSLRYFNAAGAGDRVGEVHDPETHLIPLVLQAATGERDIIEIYGTDYPTRDGTCLRDFV
ncbi:MAG: NAD-dependent epimerase/dehydratase family protein, partial [bacterium]